MKCAASRLTFRRWPPSNFGQLALAILFDGDAPGLPWWRAGLIGCSGGAVTLERIYSE